jgi:hypothetical protein
MGQKSSTKCKLTHCPKMKGKKAKPKFDQHKEVRAIARERVGTVKSARVIEPKAKRKKPKHKEPLMDAEPS